ncbi:bacitracin ABC transporter ATP-binding protein [Caldalkalibacillus thermarum]|uniref:ABC transporter ATP-binding protein n=1 Tax=Caldalkalibacillus thermarum TaxID=296745 RepID=UPI001669DB77|nr:ABC transporter ATP-binding protein [Caldalkalibacillus thermarum]GGK28646.1 bacitracin ABC transporter ATP-binding protein [Caldalkalibacillus thermarum]
MIQIKNLAKSFRKHRVLLPIDDLHIEQGVCVILGLNGMGKTTLMKILVGILPPDQGIVLYNNKKVQESVSQIGVVFDQPLVYPHLSGLENLEYFNHFREQPVSKQRILGLAVEWNIPQDNRPVSTYSLGMKKRLGIALSLLGDPDFLFLDEPFNGLDFDSQEKLLQLINCYDEQGKTVILISHDFDLALKLADHILLLHQGQLIQINDIAQSLYPFIQVHIHINGRMVPDELNPYINQSRVLKEKMEIVVSKQNEEMVVNKLISSGLIINSIENKCPSLDRMIEHLAKGVRK